MILYSILVSLWLLPSIIWFFFYSYLHLGPLHGQGVVFLSYLCYAVMRPRGSSKKQDLIWALLKCQHLAHFSWIMFSQPFQLQNKLRWPLPRIAHKSIGFHFNPDGSSTNLLITITPNKSTTKRLFSSRHSDFQKNTTAKIFTLDLIDLSTDRL